MNCTIIAVMNEKGGVGKTATATALAYLLAKSGKKTAIMPVTNHTQDVGGSLSIVRVIVTLFCKEILK